MKLLKYITAILFTLSIVTSQATYGQLVIDIGTVKTADKNTAVNFGISYFRSIDSLLKSRENFILGKHSIFTFNPEFNIRFGTEDAFSSVQAKLVGTFTSFKTTDFEGYIAPDLTRTTHVYPVALGVESNSSFTIFNAIGEIGYAPYYQGQLNNVGDVLRHTKFGIWLQGGYKFRGDSTNNALVGGAKDQSSEKVNSNLFRVKGNFAIDTKSLIKIEGMDMGLTGNANVWYDVVNKRFYHKLDAIAQFYLTNGASIQAIYSKGAGAPTFNMNDQYGVGFKLEL